jgi:hypothetical protein
MIIGPQRAIMDAAAADIRSISMITGRQGAQLPGKGARK